MRTTIPNPSTSTSNPPAAAAPAGPLKKVSFGGIAKKKEDTKTAYPIFPDANGQAATIAARVIERTAELEALEGALETDKAELKMMATPFYFQNAHGKAEVASSVAVKAGDKEVLVTFQNRYKALPDETPVAGILGDRLPTCFKQSFELKIEGDKLPVSGADELLAELQELFAKHNATDALSVKECIKPLPDFHARRHIALSVEENLALEQACPIVAMVKTKGRK